MRQRGGGWMHTRWVQDKPVVVLAEDLGGDHPRVTWYCEGGEEKCGSADVPAERWTAHDAIVMRGHCKEWYTINDQCFDPRLRAALGCVGSDPSGTGTAGSHSYVRRLLKACRFCRTRAV